MSWAYLTPLVLVLIYALYTVIPDLLLHRLGIGCWKRQYTPGVAITFDDGPNPEVTPQVLDVLDRAGVKAVFFLVGEKAARYPEITRSILARGHQLGAHSQYHRHAWASSPGRTWRDLDGGIRTLEQVTGETVTWFRPPWGTFNLVTWLWMRSRGKQAVLYDVDGRDWKRRNPPSSITGRILKRVRPGSIVLLHDDGGEPGAPLNTLRSLGDICRGVRELKKLPLVELAFPAWPLSRRLIFRLWEGWEGFFARIYKIERVGPENILRLSRSRFPGPAVFGPDGLVLARPGDPAGEIHFDNLRLSGDETDPMKTGLRALRLARDSLPGLAAYIQAHPEYREAEVFFGLSRINRGVKGLGFQVQEVPPSIPVRLVGALQRVIARVYRPPGAGEKRRPAPDPPKLVWISRERLFDLWLKS
ncbi:MAG: polysaccharide deacetylase family protein [Firmicutes bacterium]|nr:polysaccharide deacetylase family protein [Bacillota bacterium]